MAYYFMVLFHLFILLTSISTASDARVNVYVAFTPISWETNTSMTFTELSVDIKPFHISNVLYSIIFEG